MKRPRWRHTAFSHARLMDDESCIPAASLSRANQVLGRMQLECGRKRHVSCCGGGCEAGFDSARHLPSSSSPPPFSNALPHLSFASSFRVCNLQYCIYCTCNVEEGSCHVGMLSRRDKRDAAGRGYGPGRAKPHLATPVQTKPHACNDPRSLSRLGRLGGLMIDAVVPSHMLDFDELSTL